MDSVAQELRLNTQFDGRWQFLIGSFYQDLERKLDDSLQEINTYYKDLVQGKVLKNLEIIVVVSGGFKNYMESEGKLGGQNKLPRLSNDRQIVDSLMKG